MKNAELLTDEQLTNVAGGTNEQPGISGLADGGQIPLSDKPLMLDKDPEPSWPSPTEWIALELTPTGVIAPDLTPPGGSIGDGRTHFGRRRIFRLSPKL